MKKKNATRRVIRSESLGSHSNVSSEDEGRSPSPLASDYEFYQPSDSPAEDFGEQEDDQEWPVKGIVGEEILRNGQRRYQVEWEGWQREDGTNTTWTYDLPGDNTLLKSWKSGRTKAKVKEAKKSSIDLMVLDTFMPHDFRSAEDAVAYEEKLKKWTEEPEGWDEWLAMDVVVKEEDEPSASSIPEVSRKRKRLASSSSGASGSRASSSRFGEDEPTLVGSPAPNSSKRRGSYLSQPKEIYPWKRTPPLSRSTLEARWAKCLALTGAAMVHIATNIVDDEKFPPVPANFQYLENTCIYDIGVPKPAAEENKAFIIGCDCLDGCDDVLSCSCLVDSQCVDEYGEPTPAYDEKGLFLFSNQREIVECNENCACKRRCNNTSAQKPRKEPLEVFKTRHNGWGVRPLGRIRRGTVLGLYTGNIIKRDQLSSLTAEAREYTFDLDVRDDDDELERYSVCAYNAGNWTRFVNHSCSPNAIVYSVVFDMPTAANIPYIAYVASEDIPPFQEITIDYNPKASRIDSDELRKKRKSKKKLEEGQTLCVCGSGNCRGFI